MNAVDLAILIVIGFSAVTGLRRGFMLGMVDLFAFALALVAGARMTELIAGPLRERDIPNPLAAGIGFFIAAVVTYAVLGFAVRALLAPLGSYGAGTPLGWVNSVLGLVPGAMRGLALAALLIIVLNALPTELRLRQYLVSSQLAVPLATAGREALDAGMAWAGVDPTSIGLPAPPPTTD